MTKRFLSLGCFVALFTLTAFFARAETKLPSILGSHMVLQQGAACPIWGWDDAGTEVTVSFAGQTHTAKAGKDGRWQVSLTAMKANAKGAALTVKGSSTVKLNDVLVGEVWLCSGQSNMGFPVAAANDPDLEQLSANYPNIRLIAVPRMGTQEPQDDFDGQWEACTPDTVGQFSAVGYFFGRQIHQTLNVPVGLIDNAWGGSACEAWIQRNRLEKLPAAKPYMAQWAETEAKFDESKMKADYENKMALWQKRFEKAKSTNKSCKTI